MNHNSFEIKTSDIVNTKWLSIRPFACYFSNYELSEFKTAFCKDGFDPLGKFVLSLRSGEYIPKDNYVSEETNYIYLTVGNFSREELDLRECTYLDNEVGQRYEKIKVDEGDIVITRSGTVGKVAVFHIKDGFEDKIFVPSHHLAIIKTSTPEDHLFLKYYLNYGFCSNFFDAFSTGKVQKEITNWAIKRMPIPKSLDKKVLTKQFKLIDEQINAHLPNVISLQESIDEVFSDAKIKSKSLGSYRATNLVSSLKNVSKNKSLRIGAEYNDFWLTHTGHLFEGTTEDIDIIHLKRIITLAFKKIVPKGVLTEPRILIDFEQVESPDGKIIDFENIVTELGSDKLEFADSDFLTNKLRPYLGYTVLNKPDLNLIGTTEFIPFHVIDKSSVEVEYIRYTLLSSEYLEKSKFLMSGKEHPRINPIDILNIKIPLPKPKVQGKIIAAIKEREAKSQKARDEIRKLRASVHALILSELEK